MSMSSADPRYPRNRKIPGRVVLQNRCVSLTRRGVATCWSAMLERVGKVSSITKKKTARLQWITAVLSFITGVILIITTIGDGVHAWVDSLFEGQMAEITTPEGPSVRHHSLFPENSREFPPVKFCGR